MKRIFSSRLPLLLLDGDLSRIFRAAETGTIDYTLAGTLLLLVNNSQKPKFLVAKLDTEFHSKYDPITIAKTQIYRT
jgi:hypothetical protein